MSEVRYIYSNEVAYIGNTSHMGCYSTHTWPHTGQHTCLHICLHILCTRLFDVHVFRYPCRLVCTAHLHVCCCCVRACACICRRCNTTRALLLHAHTARHTELHTCMHIMLNELHHFLLFSFPCGLLCAAYWHVGCFLHVRAQVHTCACLQWVFLSIGCA
jgi:hypothetical protein